MENEYSCGQTIKQNSFYHCLLIMPIQALTCYCNMLHGDVFDITKMLNLETLVNMASGFQYLIG